MIKFDPSGHAQSFVVPLVGSRDVQRAAIRAHLMGVRLEPAAASPTTEPTESDFDSVLAELIQILGTDLDKVLPGNEIAALRADPVARERFTRNLQTSRALARRDDTKAAITAANLAVTDGERETSRLAALGIAVGAAERGAAK